MDLNSQNLDYYVDMMTDQGKSSTTDIKDPHITKEENKNSLNITGKFLILRIRAKTNKYEYRSSKIEEDLSNT